MDMRVKKISSQLGKRIPEPGAHMPSSAVGILRKKRSEKKELNEELKGGSHQKPIKEYNPFPMKFLPGSM